MTSLELRGKLFLSPLHHFISKETKLPLPNSPWRAQPERAALVPTQSLGPRPVEASAETAGTAHSEGGPWPDAARGPARDGLRSAFPPRAPAEAGGASPPAPGEPRSVSACRKRRAALFSPETFTETLSPRHTFRSVRLLWGHVHPKLAAAEAQGGSVGRGVPGGRLPGAAQTPEGAAWARERSLQAARARDSRKRQPGRAQLNEDRLSLLGCDGGVSLHVSHRPLENPLLRTSLLWKAAHARGDRGLSQGSSLML